MKTKIRFREGFIEQYLQAENLEENIQIIRLVKRLKKPNKASGYFADTGLAWIWLDLPAKKISDYETTRISSEST